MNKKMIYDAEPVIAVGLVEDAARVRLAFEGGYRLEGRRLGPGSYEARADGGTVTLLDPQGAVTAGSGRLHFLPEIFQDAAFTVRDIQIGRDFHWERVRDQRFQGEMLLESFTPGTLTIINRIPLELYLKSVVCSEMSPRSPTEFLKAHCVISRSWLLAQLRAKELQPPGEAAGSGGWTDAAAHSRFDVCADDHCQRYHGIGTVNAAAEAALTATRGQGLVFEGAVCDTRFSKCCGGLTEKFATAWQDREVAYLAPVEDGPSAAGPEAAPAMDDAAARDFIRSKPAAFCNVGDRALLARILPDFDFETRDFFRWRFELPQEELGEILRQKTGMDFGGLKKLVPLQRGASGRIFSLRVCGEKAEKTFGKELEIRRILSRAHLYSSAFVVEPVGGYGDVPERFVLHGAGWGHGVGLCQVGAAAMADRGYSCEQILQHYFRGAQMERLY